MDKKQFDNLSKSEKNKLVLKSLAWFCVMCEFNPMFKYMDVDSLQNIQVIKIVLGEFRD